MTTPPVPRGQLPPLPKGAQVTAWCATLPAGTDALSPRMAMVVLLHVSWLRWLEYSALLEEQVREAGGQAGLVGSTIASGRGGLYATGSEVLALTQLEADERDRCARLAKQAHDMGLTGEDW